MTRRVQITAGVLAAVVLAVLAASAPAASVTDAEDLTQAVDGLVVGAQHQAFGTTGGASPTLTDMSIEGSGSSASVVLSSPFTDGFEDEPADAGTPEQWSEIQAADTVNVTTQRARTGSQSFYFDPGFGTASYTPGLSGHRTDAVSTSLWAEQTGDTAAQLRLTDGESIIILVAVRNGDLQYNDGSDWITLDSGVDAEEWVDIHVSNINVSAGTFAVSWEADDGDAGTEIDLPFRSSTSNGYDTLSVTSSSGAVYVDDVETHSESGTYVGAPMDVSNAQQAAFNLSLVNATATATVQENTGGSWSNVSTGTWSTTGNHTLDISAASSSELRTVLQVDGAAGRTTGSLHDESILFTDHQPEASNLSPADGASLSSETTEFSVDISDAEFSTAQGDSVEARLFVDGEQVGSDTVTSNQTVSLDHSISEGGAHTYYWELEDSYGSTTTTAERTINVPSALSVRSETNPSELVDNSTVNITYYYGEDIQRMSTSDGEVDLTGLPVDEPIIAVADADGYHSRAAVITSIYEQNTLYLLNSSLETHEVIFDISDPTDAYPRSDTVLLVQRDIELNGSTEWRTVAGDLFGAQGVTTDLQAEERYRLVIRNLETGDRAGLGSFTPVGSQQITLEPESATVDVGLEDNTSIGYSASRSGDGESIIVEYADPTQSTNTLTVMIHERFNESNVLLEDESFSDLGNLSYSEPLSASEQNQSWVVDFSWTRTTGESSETSVVVGQGPRDGLLPASLDDVYRVSIGVAILLITALLFSQLNVGVGAITTSLVGGLLWYLGFLSGVTTGPAIVLAIGASGLIYYNNGGGLA